MEPDVVRDLLDIVPGRAVIAGALFIAGEDADVEKLSAFESLSGGVGGRCGVD